MQNLALYLTCVLIWGSTWIAIKFQLGTVDPLLSISYRFGLAALILFIFAAATGRLRKMNFTGKQYLFIALQGFFLFFMNYWMFYLVSGSLASGLVAIIFCTITVMNIFNQSLFFRTPIRPQAVIASMFGLTGIASVFWPDIENLDFHDKTFLAIILGTLGTCCSSFGNMISSRNSRQGLPVLETNMLGMAIGSLLAFISAMLSGIPFTFDTGTDYILSLIYLAVFGSIIAFGSYLTLLARIGPDRAAYTAVLFPVVALLISTFYENYVWTTEALIGVALILVGNILALTKPEHLKKLSRLILLEKNAP